MIETQVECDYTLISSISELDRMVQAYRSRPNLPVCFDTETTGFDSRHGKIITLQFKQFTRQPVIVDVRWANEPQWADGFGTVLKPLFDGTLLIVGANLKFDYQWMLNRFGVRFHRLYDVMLAEQLIYGLGVSEGKSKGISFNLKAIAERRELMKVSKEERSWFVGLDDRDAEWNASLPPEQLLYCAQDVNVLEPIFRQQHKELEELGLTRVAKIEFSCLPAIADIENNGVLIDQATWREIIKEKEEEARRLENEVVAVFGPAILQARAEKIDSKQAEYDEWEKAQKEYLEEITWEWGHAINEVPPWGKFKTAQMKAWRETHPNPGKPKADKQEINVNSSQQLMDAFKVMGIPATSTRSEELDELAKEFPVLLPIVELRRAEKIVNSFGESLLKYGEPTEWEWEEEDGTKHSLIGIHPDYIQIGASTGRMSCSKPNWQQIPARSDTGKRLRACVVSSPGHKLLTADFKNIELYTLANISECPVMCRFFEEGRDLHAETARAIFDLPETFDVETFNPDTQCSYRAAGKTTNFLIVYGGGAGTLARRLRIDQEQARRFIRGYMELYPGVAQWIAEQKERVASKLSSRTLSGRVRLFELPNEPVFPFAQRSNPEVVRQYYELKREWNGQREAIKREGTNAVIQGTSADITKVALAQFFLSSVQDSTKTYPRIVAVVHDEIVVEVEESKASLWAEILADSMQMATDTFLTRVKVPRSKVTISDHWSK